MTSTERVRVTVLEPGDKVQVQIDVERTTREVRARFSPAEAPRRAKWMTVHRVKRRPGQRTVEAVIVLEQISAGGTLQWLIRANSMFMCTRSKTKPS